jgi:hypothetical protein
VKVEFTRAMCKASPTPPEDLVERAKAKMQSVKDAGEIESFTIYDTRLKTTWTRLAKDQTFEDQTAITLTLAAGAPELPKITIGTSDNEKAVANLTIATPLAKLKKFRFDWFKKAIQKKLREAGIKDYINNSQLHGAFVRARSGLRVSNLPLAEAPKSKGQSDKHFSVIANKARHEVGVVIRNVRVLKDKSARDSMLKLISQAVRQMQTSSPTYQYIILKKEFMSALQSASDGPELLGIDLPLALLAAVGRPRPVKDSNTAVYPGKGRLEIRMSQDKMEANIVNFDMALYDSPDFEVSLDWVKNELKRLGITVEMTPEIEADLGQAIASGDSLEGVLVAQGEQGMGARGPYLHPIFRDAEGRVSGDLDDDRINLRDLQQRTTVKAEQLVAEVRFKESREQAYNILGQKSHCPPDDELIIRVGDGIQQREAGRFYATCDGIPILEDDSISLSKILVHEGDVNLRTGNIDFDGPVEIKGSIDSGSKVETTGDLIVHGTIRGGFIRCGGTLTAKSGIVTGDSGRVQARGDIDAAFIENSNITCGGNLIVHKALLNSSIISGGEVKVIKTGGLIAGGQISCRESLKTFNLGFRNGAKTVINIGVDWRVELAVRVRSARLEKLQIRQQEDRQYLRELVQKSRAQMTKKHVEMKEEIQDRLTRLRTICDQAQEHLAKAENLLSYNMDSKIFCVDQLSTNVDLHVGGQKIPIPNDVAGVAIISKRRRGSFVQPIEDILAEESGNKAS